MTAMILRLFEDRLPPAGEPVYLPAAERALYLIEGEITVEQSPSWGYLAVVAARIVWDEELWYTIAARQLQYCREAGLLAQLVISVNSMALLTTLRGDFAAARVM